MAKVKKHTKMSHHITKEDYKLKPEGMSWEEYFVQKEKELHIRNIAKNERMAGTRSKNKA